MTIKHYTRQEAIDLILDSWQDGFYEWDLDDILLDGLKGLNSYTNKELTTELVNILDEDVLIVRRKKKP